MSKVLERIKGILAGLKDEVKRAYKAEIVGGFRFYVREEQRSVLIG